MLARQPLSAPRPSPSPTAAAAPDARSTAFDVSAEQLMVLAAIFWALSANRAFLTAALRGREPADPAAWGLAGALLLALVALNMLLLALVAHRRWLKPLLALVSLAAALASHFVSAYGVYIDPSMMRNALHTHPAEASELLNADLAVHLLLQAGLPLLLLWRVRVVTRSSPVWLGLARRIGLLGLCLAVLVGAVLAVFQPLSSLMRNHKELRYLITPANLVWSLGAVAAADARGAARPTEAIGQDVTRGPSWFVRKRPLVLVLVVGETARAANWGLNGYARQTTPELARLLQHPSAAGGALVNFRRVGACGTNTETSLPCMFAPVGRRNYDEDRIRSQQSLLHVAARAGVLVHWRDNQSGCKGVCDGLPGDSVTAQTAPGLCSSGPCLDEGLIADLPQRLRDAAGTGTGTQLWVLHMLGNHGPAYHRRVPPADPRFAQFQPACASDDLHQCSVTQIVNAYDNALLYTDHLLARTIALLQAQADTVDSALIYLSDHGESLGEHGLFLHGMPYAIAPGVQTQVPMLAWFSPGLESAVGLKAGCLLPTLQRQSDAPLAHDHLFHTVLGLLDLRTGLHVPAYDLSAACQVERLAAAGAR